MYPSPDDVRKQWAESNPDLDTSPMELVGLLKRATGLLGNAVEALYEGAPLTAPELDMLVPLRHAAAPVIARRIAELHGMSRAGVSKTLAKLERRGMISRVPSPADRRIALVTITEAGAEAVDALFPRQLEAEVELLAELKEDREWVLKAVRRMVEAMETASR